MSAPVDPAALAAVEEVAEKTQLPTAYVVESMLIDAAAAWAAEEQLFGQVRGSTWPFVVDGKGNVVAGRELFAARLAHHVDRLTREQAASGPRP